MSKSTPTFLFLLLWGVTLHAQSDTVKISKLEYSAELLSGINLTGYNENINPTNMLSFGIGYNFTKSWCIIANVRFGSLTYTNQFENDKGLVVEAKIKSFVTRVPVICFYNFLNNANKRKRLSLGVGFGYCQQVSTDVDLNVESDPNYAKVIEPVNPLIGYAGFGVLKATKFFTLGKRSGPLLSISLEGNLDLVSNASYDLVGAYYIPNYPRTHTDFKLHNNLILLTLGINF